MDKVTKKQGIIILISMLVFFVACGALVVMISQKLREFNIEDHMDEPVVTIDDNELTLKYASYYIITIETKVNAAALEVYPDNPVKYWTGYYNSNGKNAFIRNIARDECMNAIIRNYIYYLEALDLNLTLTDEEIQELNASVNEKLSALNGYQAEATDYTNSEFYDILYVEALAKKYTEYRYSLDNTLTEEDFNADGRIYEEIYALHNIDINKNLWERLLFGNVFVNVGEDEAKDLY